MNAKEAENLSIISLPIYQKNCLDMYRKEIQALIEFACRRGLYQTSTDVLTRELINELEMDGYYVESSYSVHYIYWGEEAKQRRKAKELKDSMSDTSREESLAKFKKFWSIFK